MGPDKTHNSDKWWTRCQVGCARSPHAVKRTISRNTRETHRRRSGVPSAVEPSFFFTLEHEFTVLKASGHSPADRNVRGEKWHAANEKVFE